jgi:hypothetical protein
MIPGDETTRRDNPYFYVSLNGYDWADEISAGETVAIGGA